METETVVEDTATGAADGAQPTGAEGHSAESHQEGASAAQSEGGRQAAADSGASKEERLAELLERQEKDPAVVFKDDELDILEEHWEGKLQPQKAKKDAADAKGDGQDDDPDKGKDDPQPDDDAKAPADPHLASALKRVGAKSTEDLVGKITELQRKITGTDAQATAQLRRDFETLSTRAKSEAAIWNDVKSGKPEAMAHALAHVEKAYGLKLVPAGGAASQGGARPEGGSPSPADLDIEEVLPKDLFVDDASHGKANGFLRGLVQQVKDMKGAIDDFKTEKTRLRQETAAQSAQVSTVDEMVKVVGLKGMESIAKIPNLRQAIEDWYVKGVDNPAFEPIQQVLDIGNEYEVDLKTAWEILRGRGFEIEVAKAEQRGRKAAFEQKPSRSLSGMQGKDQEGYKQHTDDQLREMSEDYTKAPPDWFDKDDRPNHRTIPARAWKYFFSSDEIAGF